MKTLKDDLNMTLTPTKLLSWQDVLNFLSTPRFRKESNTQVLISKKPDYWTVTASSSTKRKPLSLTARSFGVSLFDLNW